MDERLYWIWLQLVFGYGTRAAARALEAMPPRQLYEARPEQLEPLFGKKERDKMNGVTLEEPRRILARAGRLGCSVLTPEEEGYPDSLRHIYSPPAALYVYGDRQAVCHQPAFAVVGPRAPSEYGLRAARFFAQGLAARGAAVISGLAVGIDAQAHTAALDAGGVTVGVLGCGLDVDYPTENRALKRRIADHGGAILTEYPFGTPALPCFFPPRNRLISGLGRGVLVVEATLKSGTLITAGQAVQQNRDVFVVPGDIFSEFSQGIQLLLRQGAKPVAKPEEILEDYPDYQPAPPAKLEESGAGQMTLAGAPAKKRKVAPDYLGERQKAVYEALSAECKTVDQLAEETALAIGDVLAALTELEIYGLAEPHPGRLYSLA